MVDANRYGLGIGGVRRWLVCESMTFFGIVFLPIRGGRVKEWGGRSKG